MTGPPFQNRKQISAMASALERAHQADAAGFNCLLAGFDCGVSALMVAKISQCFSFDLASLSLKHKRTSV
jgi:hypothetical protein